MRKIFLPAVGIAAAILLLIPAVGFAAPTGADVKAIKAIFAARATNFVPVRGQPQGTDKGMWYGAMTVAGLACYVDAGTADHGAVYGCSAVRGNMDLDGKAAKRLYDEVKAAINAAVPGMTWFTVPPATIEVAEEGGTSKDALTVHLQYYDLGPTGSEVSFEIAAQPYSRSDVK